MICTCGLATLRVLSTRTRADGVVLRRRVCVDGHRWTSYEIHESAAKGVGLQRIADCAERVRRGTQARQQAQSTRELVAHYPELSSSAVAAIIGCTSARVRQIRAEAS